MTRQYDKGIAEAEKGVAANPNSAMARVMMGKTLSFAGRWEESISPYKKAIRLNPIPPSMYLYSLGLSYAYTGQYEEGITWCEKAVRQAPDSLYARIMMTVVYSFSGQDEKARAEAAEVLRIQPRGRDCDIPLFPKLIMSGKCQRFGHSPLGSSQNVDYIL
jgi:tetratricopeptide (TPR) repeat protein